MQLVQAQYFDTKHLREFSGPIASFNFPPLTVARNLRAVHFIDEKSVFLLNARKFGDDFERLEVLSLQVTTPWDDEVVLAACSVFPNVLRVRIEYSGPGPNDVGANPWFHHWMTIDVLPLELYRELGTSRSDQHGAAAYVPAVRDEREATGDRGRRVGGRLDERGDAQDVDFTLEQVLSTAEGGATCGWVFVEEGARKGLLGPKILPTGD